MDDRLVGLTFRRIRLRRGERQRDVSERAGISPSEYSLFERGHLDGANLRLLRQAAAALEVRLELVPRWRGGDLDRLLHGRHAAMTEDVAAMLIAAGWEVFPEVTFNHFGERGVIDLVAWNPLRRALLLVEVKTELVDVNGLLGTADRRRRLAPIIASERGWAPSIIASWVVVADSRTNRRHVAAHRELLRAAFPADGRQVRAWLRSPTRPQGALWFLPSDTGGGLRRGAAPIHRVRRKAPRSAPGA